MTLLVAWSWTTSSELASLGIYPWYPDQSCHLFRSSCHRSLQILNHVPVQRQEIQDPHWYPDSGDQEYRYIVQIQTSSLQPILLDMSLHMSRSLFRCPTAAHGRDPQCTLIALQDRRQGTGGDLGCVLIRRLRIGKWSIWFDPHFWVLNMTLIPLVVWAVHGTAFWYWILNRDQNAGQDMVLYAGPCVQSQPRHSMLVKSIFWTRHGALYKAFLVNFFALYECSDYHYWIKQMAFRQVFSWNL